MPIYVLKAFCFFSEKKIFFKLLRKPLRKNGTCMKAGFWS